MNSLPIAYKARLLRLVLVGLMAFIAVAMLPHLRTSSRPFEGTRLHGQEQDGNITYDHAPVADVLDDVDHLTGFHAVAFPQVSQRLFTGTLALDPDGSRMATALAGRLGLEVRLAGPHWALTDGSR